MSRRALLAAVAVALLWANSPWQASYHVIWEVPIDLMANGSTIFNLTVHTWITDGVMAMFFLIVGLEIKRELLVDELASPGKALLPVAIRSIGGMLPPAAIYALLDSGTVGKAGWGIPMATDTAFTLGVLALVGRRVPTSLKALLTSFAIVDDLGPCR